MTLGRSLIAELHVFFTKVVTLTLFFSDALTKDLGCADRPTPGSGHPVLLSQDSRISTRDTFVFGGIDFPPQRVLSCASFDIHSLLRCGVIHTRSRTAYVLAPAIRPRTHVIWFGSKNTWIICKMQYVGEKRRSTTSNATK